MRGWVMCQLLAVSPTARRGRPGSPPALSCRLSHAQPEAYKSTSYSASIRLDVPVGGIFFVKHDS